MNHPTDLLKYTRDDILLSLQELIMIQTLERDQHLGTDSAFRERVKTELPLSQGEIQNFITKLERENPDLGKILTNHQENITILKTILSLGNIVVADLRNEQTRREIDRWEHLEKIAAEQRRRDGHTGLGESTQMQHLVHHGSEKTHEILTAFVNYFNHLFKKYSRLKTSQFKAKFKDYPSLITIEKELTTYSEYCKLIAQIIDKLGFGQPNACCQWKDYAAFQQNVERYIRNPSLSGLFPSSSFTGLNFTAPAISSSLSSSSSSREMH